MLGRDCRVAWQSEESAKIQRVLPGTPMIAHKLVIPTEEIRDAIFAGKPMGFRDQPIGPEWDIKRLITRDYRPLFDRDKKIIGIVAIGFSRIPSAASELEDLRAIVRALESPEPPNELCAEARFLGSSLAGLSGSQRLAQRLQRFLPQPLH